jgi:ribosomal protein L25 (general stress protein Ctc)
MSKPVDVSLSLPFLDPLLMKDTKMVAVPIVVIDAKTIEAITYNITATAQIQPSMSEPAIVSLPLPSSDLLLMKDTKTAAVSTLVIDAKTIEVIAYNIAVTVQIQPSMSEPVDVSLPLPSSDLLLMKDTKMAAVLTLVIDAKTIEAIAYNIAVMAQI